MTAYLDGMGLPKPGFSLSGVPAIAGLDCGRRRPAPGISCSGHLFIGPSEGRAAAVLDERYASLKERGHCGLPRLMKIGRAAEGATALFMSKGRELAARRKKRVKTPEHILRTGDDLRTATACSDLNGLFPHQRIHGPAPCNDRPNLSHMRRFRALHNNEIKRSAA